MSRRVFPGTALHLWLACAALVLVPPLVQVLVSWHWQGGAVDGEAMSITVMIFMVWVVITTLHVKILIEARELRLPRLPRRLLLSLAGLLAWTFGVMQVPALVWPDAAILWPELIGLGICAGGLFALSGTVLQPVIGLAVAGLLLEAGFHWPDPAGAVSRGQLGILALVLPLIIAGWLWMITRALRRGESPGFLGPRGLYDFDAGSDADTPLTQRAGLPWTVPRRGARSTVVVRAALGPEFGLRTLWGLLFLAPLAIVLSPMPLIWLGMPLCFGSVLGTVWIVRRVRRLAVLLCEPGGEGPDLALLPGLGGLPLLRRALLREALIRPLAQGALCLGLIVASHWAMLQIGGARWTVILPLALLAVGLLLLCAAMTVGVLAGRLRLMSPRSPRLFLLVVIFLPSCLLAVHDIDGHGSSLSAWQWAAWLLELGIVAACLITWGLALCRRPRLLYP